MNISEVTSRNDFRDFLEVPRVLYANDPNFISAMDNDLEKILTPKNKLVGEGNLKLWVARDEQGELIGRIAAFFEIGKVEGGIGFFESPNDKAVAHQLFDLAIDFLQNNTIHKVSGPINFGERDKFWGLLVKGFRPPMYQENYNPPYYRDLFESYGFKKAIEQTTYEIAPDYFDARAVKRQASMVEESDEFHIEHFHRHSLERYAGDFAQIYNASWAEYDHYEPLSKERVVHLMESMEHVLREDLIWFTYYNNKPVAFYVSIIDVNQILKHLNGKMNLWGVVKFFWYKNRTRVNRIKGLVFGVVPEFQGKGIYSAMIMRMYNLIKKDPYLKYSELSWIGDFNPRMTRLLKTIGARECKVHYTYELSLEQDGDNDQETD